MWPPRPRYGLPFGAAVWAGGYVVLPRLGVYKDIWKYDLETLKNIVVVSDGTHLFRVHALCESSGLHVFTSPRPETREPSAWDAFQRTMHEIVSYTWWHVRRAI